MQLFRLTRAKHARDFSGEGAVRFAGRWHDKGSRVLYASTSQSLALSELAMQVHRQAWMVDLVWTVLEVPDEWWNGALAFDAVRVPENPRESREFGRAWLEAGETPMMRVPSALLSSNTAPGFCDVNVVLNVGRSDFRSAIRCAEVMPLQVDARFQRRMLDAG